MSLHCLLYSSTTYGLFLPNLLAACFVFFRFRFLRLRSWCWFIKVKSHLTEAKAIVVLATVRKLSLRRLCFYTCLSVILFRGECLHAGMHTTPRQTLSGSRHPPAQCMLGDMGNKRVVRILLECILVSFMVSQNSQKFTYALLFGVNVC